MFVVAGWVFNISALDSWAACGCMAMIHDSVSETRQQLEYYFPPPGFTSVKQPIMNKT